MHVKTTGCGFCSLCMQFLAQTSVTCWDIAGLCYVDQHVELLQASTLALSVSVAATVQRLFVAACTDSKSQVTMQSYMYNCYYMVTKKAMGNHWSGAAEGGHACISHANNMLGTGKQNLRQ